jgi:hypothetical protein
MFKRIIIGLFTISVVAMFWASADAQPVVGPYNCKATEYVDPLTEIGWYICDYYVWWNGTWVLSKQWVYWAGGSGIQGIRFKVSRDAKDCVVYGGEQDKVPNATRCSITASVMFGTVEPHGDPTSDPIRTLSYDNQIYGLQLMINPKCYRKNPPPECGDPPGDTSGNPGLSPGTTPIEFNFYDDCVKNGMCEDTVELPFDIDDCPNDRWDCTFIAEKFLGLTCNALFGLGWYTIPEGQPGAGERILVPCGSRDRVEGLDPDKWDGGFGTCKEITITTVIDKKSGATKSETYPFIEETVTLGYCKSDVVLTPDYQVGDPVIYDCFYNEGPPLHEIDGEFVRLPSDNYCSDKDLSDLTCIPFGEDNTNCCYVKAPDPDYVPASNGNPATNGPLTFCSDLFNRGFNEGYQSPLDQ